MLLTCIAGVGVLLPGQKRRSLRHDVCGGTRQCCECTAESPLSCQLWRLVRTASGFPACEWISGHVYESFFDDVKCFRT